MKRRITKIVPVAALSLAMAAGTVVPLAGCSGGTATTQAADDAATTQAADDSVTESGEVKLDGIYVNDSYQSETNENYRLVYALLTITPATKTLTVSPSYYVMKIGEHEYDSTYVSGSTNFMKSYYYSENIYEEVALGDSGKLALTFEVLKDDLEGDETITFSKTSADFEGLEDLKISASKVEHAESQDALAKAADPDGYAAEETARQDADEETTANVNNAIVNRYWLTTAYKVEFFEGNRYEASVGSASGQGTYSVKNGYIVLQSDAGTDPTCIPWSWDSDGSIDLDIFNPESF
jgi:hypothetical protein